MTTKSPIKLIDPTGSTSGQTPTSTGPSTPPAWGNPNAATLNGATFASPGAIGGTTPGAGTFTTVNASGLITPSSTVGIKGTVAVDNAQAGSIGEFITASASGVTANSAFNITSISLTAGDWDVSGAVQFIGASVTSASFLASGVSTTSATLGAFGQNNVLQFTMTSPSANHLPTPVWRLSISSTTTVFLVGGTTFTGGTMTANGIIRARRVR